MPPQSRSMRDVSFLPGPGRGCWVQGGRVEQGSTWLGVPAVAHMLSWPEKGHPRYLPS